MEAATRAHFFNHAEASAKEKAICHFCQIRSFATNSKFPITIVNETEDGETLNPNFRFIERSQLTRGVSVVEDSFRSGCDCKYDHDCMYSDCLCLQEMAPDSDEDDEPDEWADCRTNGGHQSRRRKRFAYYSGGAKKGLLRSRILHSREPIYECHKECSCSSSCPNRVVERGRTVPLQIFRTENRGWGVRSAVDIKKGQFVDLYVGEVLTSKEANKRRAASTLAQRKDVYLFALDKFTDRDSVDPRLHETLEVDGEFMSGPTRFVNHSCDPNMRIFARVGDHADKHMHDLAMFAIKDIPKGEELTFDYVDGNEDPHDDSQKHDMTECLCGSKKCRGFLW